MSIEDCDEYVFEHYQEYLKRQPIQGLDYFMRKALFEEQMAKAISKIKENSETMVYDHEDSEAIFTTNIRPR